LKIARVQGADTVKASSQSTGSHHPMNTSTSVPPCFHPTLPHALLALACGAGFTLCGFAQDTAAPARPVTSATVAATPDVAEAKPAEAPKKSAHTLPAAFEEVVKMSESGVSTDLLLQFVETSATTARPTGTDIITMKERGLPDAVIVTMMHRGAQAASRPNASRDTIAAPVIVRTLATDGQLDPESYEFFWYHHAYPRALQKSYETLAPYHPSYRQQPFYSNQRIPWRTTGFSKDSFTPGQSRLPKVQSGRR